MKKITTLLFLLLFAAATFAQVQVAPLNIKQRTAAERNEGRFSAGRFESDGGDSRLV